MATLEEIEQRKLELERIAAEANASSSDTEQKREQYLKLSRQREALAQRGEPTQYLDLIAGKKRKQAAEEEKRYSQKSTEYNDKAAVLSTDIDEYNKRVENVNQVLENISKGLDIAHVVNISTREYSSNGNIIYEFTGRTDAGGRYANEYASGDVLLADRGGSRTYTTKEEAEKKFIEATKGKFGLNENDIIYVNGKLVQASTLNDADFKLAQDVSKGVLDYEQAKIKNLKEYRESLKGAMLESGVSGTAKWASTEAYKTAFEEYYGTYPTNQLLNQVLTSISPQELEERKKNIVSETKTFKSPDWYVTEAFNYERRTGRPLVDLEKTNYYGIEGLPGYTTSKKENDLRLVAINSAVNIGSDYYRPPPGMETPNIKAITDIKNNIPKNKTLTLEGQIVAVYDERFGWMRDNIRQTLKNKEYTEAATKINVGNLWTTKYIYNPNVKAQDYIGNIIANATKAPAISGYGTTSGINNIFDAIDNNKTKSHDPIISNILENYLKGVASIPMFGAQMAVGAEMIRKNYKESTILVSAGLGLMGTSLVTGFEKDPVGTVSSLAGQATSFKLLSIPSDKLASKLPSINIPSLNLDISPKIKSPPGLLPTQAIKFKAGAEVALKLGEESSPIKQPLDFTEVKALGEFGKEVETWIRKNPEQKPLVGGSAAAKTQFKTARQPGDIDIDVIDPIKAAESLYPKAQKFFGNENVGIDINKQFGQATITIKGQHGVQFIRKPPNVFDIDIGQHTGLPFSSKPPIEIEGIKYKAASELLQRKADSILRQQGNKINPQPHRMKDVYDFNKMSKEWVDYKKTKALNSWILLKQLKLRNIQKIESNLKTYNLYSGVDVYPVAKTVYKSLEKIPISDMKYSGGYSIISYGNVKRYNNRIPVHSNRNYNYPPQNYPSVKFSHNVYTLKITPYAPNKPYTPNVYTPKITPYAPNKPYTPNVYTPKITITEIPTYNYPPPEIKTPPLNPPRSNNVLSGKKAKHKKQISSAWQVENSFITLKDL